MTGSTVIIEIHSFRGIIRAGGPLGVVYTLGFVSVMYAPFLLSEWLRERVSALQGLTASHRLVEMACVGDEAGKRSNVSVRTDVPHTTGRKK